MGLGIKIDINGNGIGKAFIRRTEYVDISDPAAIADKVLTYAVHLNGLMIGYVEHRYGDGAWKLVAIASEFIHKYQDTEKPECQLGYPIDQVQRILGDRFPEFNEWIAGQTVSICDGRSYNYETKQYEETGCGPHGSVIYSWDLDRFLKGLPVID